jgi:pilus assembly protein Flp/PilA
MGPSSVQDGGIEMKSPFARIVRQRSGATVAEYGLIAALIGIAIIAGAAALGNKLESTLNFVSSTAADTPAIDFDAATAPEAK